MHLHSPQNTRGVAETTFVQVRDMARQKVVELCVFIIFRPLTREIRASDRIFKASAGMGHSVLKWHVALSDHRLRHTTQLCDAFLLDCWESEFPL